LTVRSERHACDFIPTSDPNPVFPELIIALLLALVAAFWADSMGARERANEAARDICARNGLSLLDETVALATRQLIRGSRGHLTLRRTYTFDYCEDGYSRSSGFIILQGHRVTAMGLAPEDTRY
jgi:hypothetical protein